MNMVRYRAQLAGILLLTALLSSACGAFNVEVQTPDAQPSAAAEATGDQAGLEATNAALRATITALEAAQSTVAEASTSTAPSPGPQASAVSTASARPRASAVAEASLPAFASAEAVAEASPPAFVSAEAIPIASAAPVAQPPTLLLLDASGSMLQDDGSGTTRIDTAKAALNTLVDALPEGAPVGLRVYGHRVPNTDKPNGCQDTELVSPVAPVDKAALKERIASFQATGWTPISLSLEQGAADLPPEGERTIVLVSDGLETCDRDPCQIAAQLKQQGIDLVVDTIGFQVDATARAQLECIAQATGGEYRDVQNAGELGEQLKQVAIPPPPVGTAEIGGLTFESAPVVQPGLYSTTLKQGETRFFAVEVPQGQRLLASGSLLGQPDALSLYASNSYSTEAIFTVYNSQRAPARLEDGIAELRSIEQYQVAVGATFGVVTGIAGEGELQPGRYYVAMALRDREGQLPGREFPAEIGIRLEGANPPASSAAAPGPNPGGLSFDAAPLVQNGAYTGSIKAGETRFYAIDVADGQRLRASTTLVGQPDLRAVYEGKNSYALTISFAVYNAQRKAVDLPDGVVTERIPQYAGTSNESFGADLGPVGSGELEPGRYYIALRLRDRDNVTTGREFQTEYGFEVSGP